MAAEIFKLVGRITYEGQKKVEAGLTKLGKKVEAAQEKLESFGDAARDTGAKVQGVGEGLTTYVTAPMLGLGAAAGIAASGVQEAAGLIEARLGSTGKRAEELTKISQNLFKNAYGESIQAAALNVATLDSIMQELDGETLQYVAEGAYSLEKAFGAGVNETAKAGKALMDNFGISGKKAIDLLTTGFQKTGDYSEDLIDTVYEYSSQFKAVGISAEGMFNMLIQGAKNGAWNMDKVGDAVKEFNIRAQDGSDATAEGFAAIGLNADKMGQKIAQGGEKGRQAFMATIAALAAMKDPVQRNIAGVALFGTQWEDLRGSVVTALNPAKDMLGEVEGAAKRAGDALQDNFKTRAVKGFRQVMAGLQPLGNALLDVADRVIPKIVSGAEKLSTWFSNLSPSAQNLTLIFGGIATAIGPLLIILGMLISNIGVIAGVLAGVTAPVWGWIAAIVALVAILITAYKKSETFRNIVNQILVFLKGVFIAGFQAVVAFVQQLLGQLRTYWQENGAMIMQAISNVGKVLKAIFMVLFPIILAIVKSTWGYIKLAFQGAVNLILGIIKFFSALFTGNWKALFSSIGQILKGALQLIWGIFNLMLIGKLLGGIKTLALKGWGLFKSWGTKIIGFFKNLGANIAGTANAMKTKVVGYIKALWDRARYIFQIFRNTGSSIFNAIKNTITNSVRNLKDDAVSVFSSLWSRAKSIFNNIKNAVTHPIETAKNTIKRIVDTIKGFFTKMNIKIPKIGMPPLPHFRLKGKLDLTPPSLSVPKLSVDWYAKGGVFDGASVIGVGEAGPEAVVPLLGPRMRPFAQAIANEMGGAAAAAGQMIVKLVMPNGRVLAEETIDYTDQLLQERKESNLHRTGGRTS